MNSFNAIAHFSFYSFFNYRGLDQQGEKNRLLMMIDYVAEWVYQIESKKILFFFFFFKNKKEEEEEDDE